MNGFFLFFATSIVVMTAITLAGFNSRLISLKEWHNYGDCVDEYMQINDYQVELIDTNQNKAVTNLVIACFIFCIHAFGLLQSMKACGCKCKCCPCCMRG